MCSTLTATAAAFVQARRVARLATADAAGQPHVVPVCYAFDGTRFYTPLDEKPKRVPVTALRRVRNISARREAALLIDHYDDDWSRLGYVLVHAQAGLLWPQGEHERREHAAALALLRERYAQYRTMALEEQPLIVLVPRAVSSWGSALAPPVTDPATDGARSIGFVKSLTGSVPLDNPRTLAEPGEASGSGRGVDFLPLARGRRSVRAYDGRPVPRALLEEALEAACWAPSPHGRQPWRFVVLTRDEPKRRLAAAMGEEWRRTLAMDGQPAETVRLRLAKSHQRIVAAPALVLALLYLEDLDRYPDAERQRAEEIMAIQSLGAALQNLLLAAYARGLDGGWMCAPLFCPRTVRAALDLDNTLIPHALLTLGYAARDPQRRPHRPLDELVLRFD